MLKQVDLPAPFGPTKDSFVDLEGDIIDGAYTADALASG
jgi:hypothetical protein